MNLNFKTRDLIIATSVLSAMALVAGMLYQGIAYGGMLSFILASNIAPLGLAILVFWGLKFANWNQKQKQERNI